MEEPKQPKRSWGETLFITIMLIPFLIGLAIALFIGLFCSFPIVGVILFPALWILVASGGATSSDLTDVFVRCLIVFILAALFFPLFAQARNKTRTSTCLSHMQQITQSSLLYAQDYDGNLPPVLTSSSTPFPYIADRSTLICPEASNTTGSYSRNINVRNVAFNAMAWPEKTILVYEGNANTLDYRHSDRATIGFADGHCKLVGPQDITTLFWTPQAPPNLPDKPYDKAGPAPEISGPVYMR